jgi:hypothetical protein
MLEELCFKLFFKHEGRDSNKMSFAKSACKMTSYIWLLGRLEIIHVPQNIMKHK